MAVRFTRVFAVFAVVGALLPTALAAQSPFPHDQHERLFPLCEGCHDPGSGQPSDLYPTAELCGQCHDGDQAAAVRWAPPTDEPAYGHPVHVRGTGVALACTDCHRDDAIPMAELAGSCAGCHEQHHEASTRCRVCHETPMAEHTVAAHTGCAGSGCHEAPVAERLTFDRELCLLCHRDQVDHRPGRRCGDCHAVGQPGG
jgi:hypothetical protein